MNYGNKIFYKNMVKIIFEFYTHLEKEICVEFIL